MLHVIGAFSPFVFSCPRTLRKCSRKCTPKRLVHVCVCWARSFCAVRERCAPQTHEHDMDHMHGLLCRIQVFVGDDEEADANAKKRKK